MIGKTLGHYEITDKLGQGGMGSVWLAQDSKLGRQVAIKTLPEEFAQDEERLARFEREAKLLASLNHPNIATIHGLEEYNGTRFLVLELVEGDTLADRLKRGAIPVEESLKLALQIAEALEAAHKKGVIHRDLKPANIKVTPDGKVKVLDFGLAKAFAGDGSDANLSQSPTISMTATQQGVILGTPAYLSPEQARGQEVDKRADVWAFGVVLFEMLTGRGTFDGGMVSDVLAGVLRADPDWNNLPPHLHPRIQFLLERCLEKESKDRYGDISDARVDIQKVLSDPDGVIVQPVAERVQVAPQSKLPWMAGMLLTLIIGGAAVWYLKPADPRPISRFDYDLPEGIGFTNTVRQVVAISPDGRQFVYRGTGGLYLRAMDGLEAQMIAGTGDNLANPVFSPDGQQIAYMDFRSNSGRLMKVAVTGGAPTVLTEPVGTFGISWETNGTILWGQPDGIWQMSENGGTPVQLISTEEEGQAYGPQLLPGGEWILFTLTSGTGPDRWDEAADIVIESLSSGERRILRRGGSDARYVASGHLVYALEDVLFAMPFDVDALELSGGPVSILQGVRRSSGRFTGSANYSFSSGGTLVYLPAADNASGVLGDLVWVYRDGTEAAIKGASHGYGFSHQLSSDGNHVVYAFNQNIWSFDIETGVHQQLTFAEEDDNDPVWHPDGQRIAFSSGTSGAGRNIYSKVVASTEEPQALLHRDATQVPISWSPDGNVIAFYDFREAARGRRDIYTLSLLDGSVTPFIVTDSNERGPMSSPDGNFIAYVSNELGENEVFVMPYPVAIGGKRRISTQGGTEPRWRRDGRELFYRAGDNMVAVEIQTEPVFQVGQARTLFSQPYRMDPAGNANYDVDQDGTRFLMVSEPVQTKSPRIIIVQNWFEELKERVPVP